MTAAVAQRRPIPAPSRRLQALGGIAAQASQALASFTLQILAARLLGLAGLGRFGTLYAIILLATAISSGFVGDSLTVLDRRAPAVRAGLLRWQFVMSVGGGALCTLGMWATGLLPGPTAVLAGLAVAVFLVEDTVRRLLMAHLLFWRTVAVDLSALAGSLATLGAFQLAGGDIGLGDLIVALGAGQVVAIGVGALLLPVDERWLVVRHASAAMREVAAYGSWRALQQGVRTGMLAAVRMIALVVLSATAVGELEAARIYMAPALIAVLGASSFLFASYASSRETPLQELLHLADRTVGMLLGGVAAFGIAATLALPVLGPVLSDGEYDLSAIAVAGWACYAASVAAATPYGQLAAVRGRQRAVLGLRSLDSVLSLGVVVVVARTTGSAQWIPLALAACSLLGGFAIRELIVRPEIRRQALVGAPTAAT